MAATEIQTVVIFYISVEYVTADPIVRLPACGRIGFKEQQNAARGVCVRVILATNVVDLYERDAGILWAHHEDDAGTVGPRARELVIGWMSTVGNYDYRFQWSFRQDGSIEFHVYLTGVMQLKGTHAKTCAACAALADKTGTFIATGEQAYGVLVADHLLAPHHQHLFNLRLDFDVDGTRNSVKELNLTTDRRSAR